MSELERLIQELCPNGVEYVSLGTVCTIGKGVQFNKADMNDEGTYPVINGGINPSGYIEQYNQDENTITISQGGASAGYVNWLETKFWAGAHCYILKPKANVLNRYAYHFVKSQERKLQECQYGAGIPALAKGTVETLSMPVPPIAVQREIIRILDNFTELAEKLTAELVLRKKQYEYYRNILLNENKNVPTVKLKDLVIKSCSGATPSKANADFYEGGTIPWLRTQDVRFNEIWEINSFITEEAVKKTAAKWIPENCVIVAISGATAGRCAINKIATTTNQHCLNMEIDSTKALYKYVFFCVCSKYEELLSKKQGARGDLNSSLILSLGIPLPNLDEQKQIVEILNKFDSLCNDISAEIEARQKQYEYYRDKLLNFKEMSV